MENGQYRAFKVAMIREPVDPARMAMDGERLGELADSIAAEGLHQPVGVVLDADGVHADLAWGHRRLLAMRLLGRKLIDAKVFPTGTELDLARWSENGQRDDLNPLEEAHEVRRFLERGHPRAGVARMFRRSEAWLNDRLALLDLPEELRQCVSDKSLSIAVIRVLRDIDHQGYRESLIREAIAHGATAAVCEVWRAHYLSERARIVENHVTVEQMAQERQSFRLMVLCDWCGIEAAVELTRTVRLCATDYAGLMGARNGGEPAAG